MSCSVSNYNNPSENMAGKMIQGPELKIDIKGKCLGEFFFEMAKKHGDKICQIDATTGEKETFNGVRLRSIRVALHMKKSGIGPKDIISVCSRNSLDAAIPVLAATFLGALTANLDPSLSVTEAKYLISLTKPKMIFVEEDVLPLIEESLGDSNKLNIDTIVVVFGSSAEYPTFKKFLDPDEEEDKFRPALGDSDEVALILFSSGTTGYPKAICLSHKYFLESPLTWHDINSDALLSFTGLYGITTTWFLILSFFGGGYRVLMQHFDAELTFISSNRKIQSQDMIRESERWNANENVRNRIQQCFTEIRIKNDHLMLGYYNMDSSQCFDEDGFYKTGDVGYYDEDECFYIVDRIKEVFKYKWWHILPSFIEDVLSEHPQISEAVVFGVPHDEYGELPTASVVLKKNSNVTKEQIFDYVAERVQDRQKLRGGIFIVDFLPRTPTGKVSKRKARENIINSVTMNF